jgi:periplasmic protein TonB
MHLGPASPRALRFETVDLSARHGSAQSASVGIHFATLVMLAFLLAAPKPGPSQKWIPEISGGQLLSYVPPANPQVVGRPSTGGKGGGGENDQRPATFGRLAPGSSMPIVPPRKIQNDDPLLPEPPAVFDRNAPSALPVITDLGLPWMREKNDSSGPGGNHGMGSGEQGGMGDRDGNKAGEGNNDGPYGNVVSQVVCLYCPEPPYTEEARKNKLQGQMLLQVFVGEDGKAKQVRILRSLGMGLDESTERAVYGWRFAPARDAAKRPVATWITIETRFQLF